MIDTHCHLADEHLFAQLPHVIQRAQEAQVTSFIVPGLDVESSQKAAELANQYSFVYAAAGMYPSEAYGLDLTPIEYLLQDPEVVAVGEVGLDTTYADEFPLEIQLTCLREQIHLASKHQKSLILHNRGTTTELLALLAHSWDSTLAGRTVFHCCEPDEDLLVFAKKHHVYIGVDGDVTYNKKKQEFLTQVPLELLVLETDAPYLTPEPVRQEKKFPNEPAHLTYTAQKIAEIYGISVEEVDVITTQNAQTLFGLE